VTGPWSLLRQKQKEPTGIFLPIGSTKFVKIHRLSPLFALDFLRPYDTIKARISHMRKGAAGSGELILSSASVLEAPLRMSLIQKALGYQPGAFVLSVVVGLIYHKELQNARV